MSDGNHIRTSTITFLFSLLRARKVFVWHLLKACVKSRFFPHPDAEEDTVFYLWSTPEDVADPMDAAFFECLLRYASDVAEGKRRMNVFQIMVLQYVRPKNTHVLVPKY